MNVWKRASLFIIRKKSKSFTLFLLLTVICFLTTICILIGNASKVAQSSLRHNMGGYFKIQMNSELGCGQPVTDTMVDDILNAGEIKSFNGVDMVNLLTPELALIPGRFTVEGDVKAKLAKFFGNSQSQLDEQFLLKNFILIKGRHIRADDHGSILISETLAAINDLTIGDQVEAVYFNEGGDTEEKYKAVTLEIVGIFQVNSSQGTGANAECDIQDNYMFTDTAMMRTIMGEVLGKDINYYSNEVIFFATDPKRLNSIMEKVVTLPGYDWDEYQITKNNKAYDESARPLERLSTMITTFIVIITGISMILLSLILYLWIGDRIKEIGILLSIGQKKVYILLQLIIENLIIAVAAFTIAITCSQFVKYDQIIAFITETTSDDQEMKAGVSPAVGDPVYQELQDPLEPMQIKIGWFEIIQVASIGFLIIVVATMVATRQIMKMKPKDILTTMC